MLWKHVVNPPCTAALFPGTKDAVAKMLNGCMGPFRVQSGAILTRDHRKKRLLDDAQTVLMSKNGLDGVIVRDIQRRDVANPVVPQNGDQGKIEAVADDKLQGVATQVMLGPDQAR